MSDLTLTFQTPSRRCPLRSRNGQPVRILMQDSKKMQFVRRIDRAVNALVVEFPDGAVGVAYPDEILIGKEQA